jgi:hypothetical protein
MPRVRYATLAGGLGVVGLGIWILLDASGALGLSFAALGPALIGIAGIVLLLSGLEDRE